MGLEELAICLRKGQRQCIQVRTCGMEKSDWLWEAFQVLRGWHQQTRMLKKQNESKKMQGAGAGQWSTAVNMNGGG